jgi:hypothetical protein
VPLVQKICEFYRFFHESLKNFPKQEKYGLGQKIENVIIETLELTLAATYSTRENKGTIIHKVSNKIDLLKYLVRLAYETKSLNLKRYLALEEKLIEMGKMVGGWLRSNS